jgi:hypothetical protein
MSTAPARPQCSYLFYLGLPTKSGCYCCCLRPEHDGDHAHLDESYGRQFRNRSPWLSPQQYAALPEVQAYAVRIQQLRKDWLEGKVVL